MKTKNSKTQTIPELSYDARMRGSIWSGAVECPTCGDRDPRDSDYDYGCSLCRPHGKIIVSDFAKTHFESETGSPAIPGMKHRKFEKEINARFPVKIMKGYASFCHLLFFNNWTKAKVSVLPLTDEVTPFITTEYRARRDTELPVLERYVSESWVKQTAKYLCVIIYDKAQMVKEGTRLPGNADSAVVNILRLMTLEEPPLPPITMMRNALGVDEGGSGVPLDRFKYNSSVEYWKKNIAVR